MANRSVDVTPIIQDMWSNVKWTLMSVALMCVAVAYMVNDVYPWVWAMTFGMSGFVVQQRIKRMLMLRSLIKSIVNLELTIKSADTRKGRGGDDGGGEW